MITLIADIAKFQGWQWTIAAGALLAALILGGLTNRKQGGEDENEPTKGTSSDELSELNQLRQQLEARDSELKDAREEAELTLLQLHQVQEELEHYFIQSRDLQHKLDAVKTITPEQLEQVQRIKVRLVQLFKLMPSSRRNAISSQSNHNLNALVQRQQNALRRFQHLHAAIPTNTTTHSS